MKKALFVLVALAMLVLAGCGATAPSQTSPVKSAATKPQVAVAIVPQATFVKAVAGDLVDVVTMIPPGKSPGNYEPAPQEMERFSRSAVYFAIGIPTEKASILPKSKELNPSMKIVSMNDEVKKVYPEREFAPGKRDGHIWLSPKRAKLMVEIIARELSAIDPRNKDTYVNNAKKYQVELDELDKRIKASLVNLKSKSFIVYHPAFGYFADDYGLTMVELEKDGKDVTPAELGKIVDYAKQNNIKVIFYQAEIDSQQTKAFAESIGGQTEQVAPLAADYIKNLAKTAETFARVMK